jgi:hypothetical protein
VAALDDDRPRLAACAVCLTDGIGHGLGVTFVATCYRRPRVNFLHARAAGGETPRARGTRANTQLINVSKLRSAAENVELVEREREGGASGCFED